MILKNHVEDVLNVNDHIGKELFEFVPLLTSESMENRIGKRYGYLPLYDKVIFFKVKREGT